MRIEELTSDSALERLRPEWTSLWRRTAGAGPFQHPDWLLPWRRHLGGGDLLVLAVRDGQDLVALAPFYIHVDGSGGRQLTLLGNGVSDCCDVLLDRRRADAEAGLAEALRANCAGWTSCDLRDLPHSSVLLSLLSEEWSSSISVDTPTVVLDLEWWAERQSSLPSKMMADLHRRRRRAEEIGPVRMDWAAQGATEQAMDRLFALHGARWRARGEEGVLHGAALEAFYRDIAVRFSRLGWLRLSTLSVGDHVAGACLGFQLRGRAYHYIGGFDPEFAGLGIGQLMLHQIIASAARDGVYEFDFLRGDEDYKRRWGGSPRPQYRIRAKWNQSRDIERAGTG